MVSHHFTFLAQIQIATAMSIFKALITELKLLQNLFDTGVRAELTPSIKIKHTSCRAFGRSGHKVSKT